MHGIVLWGSDLSLVIKFIYWVRYGPVAQLVRAPPCHGGGRRFESVPGRDRRNHFLGGGFFVFRFFENT